MPNALVPLASFTLTSNQTSVVFNGIPQTGFRDLRLVVAANSAVTTDNAFRVNESSAGLYNNVVMYGTGSTAATAGDANATYGWIGYSNTTDFGLMISHFMDYAATDRQKNILSRYGTAGNGTTGRATRWASTSPITSITLYAGSPGGTSFTAGSTFNLYGVI